MAFEPEFLEMMPHEIVIERYLSQDFFGRKVYDVAHPRTYRCRIVGKGLSLRRQQGDDDTVVYDIYVHSGADLIQLEDKITLPEEQAWIDRTPVIFTVGRVTDEQGQHHTKIQCGWMYHRQGQ